MKRIIDISEEEYKFIKDLQFYSSGRRNGKTIEKHVINAIKNSTLYNPSGELISREALKKYARVVFDKDLGRLRVVDDLIDNAPTVPQGECKSCRHRDPEDKKCDCGAMERQGCPFPVSDDYFCKFYEKGGDNT